MTFKQIMNISDESARVDALLNYDQIGNLSQYEKIVFITRLSNEKNIIKVLSNDLVYDKDVIIYVLGASISDELKKKIATDNSCQVLRDKVINENLTPQNVDDLINAYGCDKISLNLINRSKSYYSTCENMVLRKTTKGYDEAVVNRIMDIEKVNTADRDVIKSRLKKLANVNEDILSTVNFRMLVSKYARLGEKISIITLYPEIQEKILALEPKEFNFLCTSIDYMNAMNLDWVPIADDLLNNISQYSKIINNDMFFSSFMKSQLPTKGKSSDDFMKILTIMTDKNKYKYTNFRDMINSKRADSINYALDDEFFKLTETERYRALIFEKTFGQDYETAKYFYETYGLDYDKVIEETNASDERIKNYLTDVKRY